MHRRYYVLYGNTLCWYKDADDYTHRLERPSGVVHVAAVAEWNGRVGGLKTFPHSFAVVTVEGKTLFCAAPMRQSAVAWDAALHIGLTMPPLSPHRAVAAKARRDSFDLLSTMQPSTPDGASAKARRASMAHVNATASPVKRAQRSQSEAVGAAKRKEKHREEKEKATDEVVVEGYLVKKSALVPVMKKKYCVLRRLRLAIYDSHEAYASAAASAAGSADHEALLVCGVSDWDGHGALLQYHHGFEVHTAAHASVFCSAASEQEKSKWVAGIHAALLKFHDAQLSPVSREDALLAKRQHALLAQIHGESESKGGDDVDGATSAPVTAQQRLRQSVQQLYAQHNASKLGEVPLLLERFRGRERALLEHLDRIYGTTLASAPETPALLQALAQEQAQEQQRRESTGVRSGLLDFVKMTGRLQWTSLPSKTHEGSNRSTPWSFCVLSVDKLVRYASETQYETEPFAPLETVKVLRVTTSDREHSRETQFVISCRDQRSNEEEDEEEGDDEEEDNGSETQKRPVRRVLLEAPSADQRVLWVSKLRSGLGVVASAAHGDDDDDDQNESKGDDADGRRSAFRRQLIAFYERHNPRKLGDVDALLHYFAGRESQLLRDLDATYGTQTSVDPTFVALLPLSPLKQRGAHEGHEEQAAPRAAPHGELRVGQARRAR
ncbi:hypothetical protein PINS_up012439 [Pythium insidiosum]|nr:hypothetical protein PINS_up012439 [Pythium insidiosum]